MLHFVGAFIFLLVFVWHFTQAASRLPGAKGFGWFFKFLTFWGWTIQTFQYIFVALCSITSPVRLLVTTKQLLQVKRRGAELQLLGCQHSLAQCLNGCVLS